MKKGFVGVLLVVGLLATGLMAIHCGDGPREELARLELRTVLGLQDEEVQYLYHNERLAAYDMLVEAASAQARDDELSARPDLVAEVATWLADCDKARAEKGEEPVVFSYLDEDGLRAALTDEALELADPVKFLVAQAEAKTPASTTNVEFPEGAWGDTRRDDLQGHSELSALEWLQPWIVAMHEKATGTQADRIEVIRAEGLASFVAIGPAEGEVRVNPVLLHLAAARSYDSAKTDEQAAAAKPGVVVPVDGVVISNPTVTSPVQTEPVQSDTVKAVEPKPESTGHLGTVEQPVVDAMDVSGCSTACAEDGDGKGTCICSCDCDAEGSQDSCVYGCADDPESCSTAGSGALFEGMGRQAFHWGALLVPGLVFFGWIRRIRRREQS